jgi:PA14 domain
VAATGTQPISYQWQRGTSNIAGATGPSYSLTASAADSGATFRVVVTNAFGTVTSNSATLTVSANAAPVASITTPTNGTLYSGGDTISYSGTGSDAEDGSLPASAFTWEVVFHHATHTHPFVPPTTGAKSGSFTIPRVGEVATDVFYRIHLTVRDSAGLAHTTTRDVLPRVATLSLRTNPAGLQLTLDGTPVATPADVPSVVGMTRQLGVVSPQTVGGTSYSFSSWSDGGSATHSIDTPSTSTTYTATFTSGLSGGLRAEYFDNIDFTSPKLTRTDPTLNFNWAYGSPDPSVGGDTFSVRWTGTITPAFTEAYTLYTTSDDGIRVWLNGALLIDNFTNHSPTENRGTTAVLTAGQAYSIQVDYFENTGGATATLSWSSASQSKQIIPQARLAPGSVGPTFPIRINFQIEGAVTPAGYVPDTGLIFGERNGLSFGWNQSHADVTRERNFNGNQLLDTLCHFHAGGVWELALPNGTYNVLASIGDPTNPSTHTLIVEGVTYWSARALTGNQFLSQTSAVTIADGRLTLTQGSAVEKATRINYLEVSRP